METKTAATAYLKPVDKPTNIYVKEFEDSEKDSGSYQKSTSEKSDSPTYPGQVFGENYIRIVLDSGNSSMGSSTGFINLHFGRSRSIKLYGFSGTGFPAGSTINWNLNQIPEILESIPTDAWDDLVLVNPSRDGMKIKEIKVVHSSQTILDWTAGIWLDGSTNEKYSQIGLTAKIKEHKLKQIGNSWIPQLHYAALEIGKADRRKYGTVNAWCSEFTSWCLRKALWNSPPGDTFTGEMEDYFEDLRRKKTKAQILAGDYRLSPGDYIYFQFTNGNKHSGLFLEYIGDPNNPTSSTKIRTIEGNTSKTVAIRERSLSSIVSVGSTM